MVRIFGKRTQSKQNLNINIIMKPRKKETNTQHKSYWVHWDISWENSVLGKPYSYSKEKTSQAVNQNTYADGGHATYCKNGIPMWSKATWPQFTRHIDATQTKTALMTARRHADVNEHHVYNDATKRKRHWLIVGDFSMLTNWSKSSSVHWL